jgi:hypothetical protein
MGGYWDLTEHFRSHRLLSYLAQGPQGQMEQHIMQVTVSGDRDKGVVGIGFIQFQYFFHPRRLSQLKMKTSKNTQ